MSDIIDAGYDVVGKVYALTEAEKGELATDLRASTALGRLSHNECMKLFATMEARDHWVCSPKVKRG